MKNLRSKNIFGKRIIKVFGVTKNQVQVVEEKEAENFGEES